MTGVDKRPSRSSQTAEFSVEVYERLASLEAEMRGLTETMIALRARTSNSEEGRTINQTQMLHIEHKVSNINQKLADTIKDLHRLQTAIEERTLKSDQLASMAKWGVAIIIGLLTLAGKIPVTVLETFLGVTHK